MVLLTAGAVAMGAIFASAEVTMVAFCGQHGHRGAERRSCWPASRAAARSPGSSTARRTGAATCSTGSARRRWCSRCCRVLFLAAVNIAVLAVVRVRGRPGHRADADHRVRRWSSSSCPAPSLTEGLAWVITGLNVGYGAGAALVGGIADAHGARSRSS